MAKQDYPIDVGMWAVQPDRNTGGDAALDTFVSHFEKVWDGHSAPPRRACNVLMTYGNSNAWGYLSDGAHHRTERQAYAFGEWILRIKEANASSRGAGAPRHLTGIVFRGIWNLLKVVHESAWTPCEIQQMVYSFLDYFGGGGTSLPGNKGDQLDQNDLSLLKGYLLADDFAKWPYSSQWDDIVQRVHAAQQSRSVNRPLYFSHQVFSSALWANGAPYGRRLNSLKAWLNVFNAVDATPVFMPQFYPWDGGQWNRHDERDPYVWWNVALDELLYLKDNGYPSLQVQPVIQACTMTKAGPGHPDIHNQLRAVLDHDVVNGAWLLNWNFPTQDYRWACYKAGDNRWTDKQHIAEAIQVEAGGSPEAVITSTPSLGMTGADPSTFNRQSGRNRGSGGVRLKFDLDTRQPIRIRISGPTTRTQLDGYTWSGRRYSYNGPWSKGQYTRDPKLPANHPNLNPLHGTSVNWNGWRREDTSQAPTGNYNVQLRNANGSSLGGTITVTAR